MKLIHKALCGALLIAAAGSVSATSFTLTQSGTKTLTSTGWTDNTNVLNKFDGTIGTLDRVVLTLDAQAFGDAGYENKSASLNDITLSFGANVSGSISLSVAFGTTANAVSNTLITGVPAFDGVIDFGGTSGDNLVGLNPTASNNVDTDSGFIPLIKALLLGDFTDANGIVGGLDTMVLNLSGTGASAATDTQGNVASQFTTAAGTDWALTYYYHDNAVPVPAPLALLGIGGLIIGAGRKLRKLRK